jgi:hypothetical protein
MHTSTITCACRSDQMVTVTATSCKCSHAGGGCQSPALTDPRPRDNFLMSWYVLPARLTIAYYLCPAANAVHVGSQDGHTHSTGFDQQGTWVGAKGPAVHQAAAGRLGNKFAGTVLYTHFLVHSKSHMPVC